MGVSRKSPFLWGLAPLAAGMGLGVLMSAAGPQPRAEAAWSAATAQIFAETGGPRALEAWLDDVAKAAPDVLFLGERHDSAAHHALQAAIVAGLERRFDAEGGVAGVVFEMIDEGREADALAARGWPAPASPEESRAVAAAVGWAESGWPEFALYAPILEAAPRAYLAGGGYPRRAIMQAATDAAWLRREPDAERFGLDEALPPAQQAAREAGQIASHCNAIPAYVAPMMVDAQRARDGRLAAAVLRARGEAAAAGRMGPIVVITGGGHARLDYGAPALLRRAAPALRQVSLSMVEQAEPLSAFAVSAERAALFDYWAPTPFPAAPRPDPCEAFTSRAQTVSPE